MRKLTGLKVVLLVVGLLTMAMAPPATAQWADPLSLAASGVLLPYFNDGAAGFVSVLEVVSPVQPLPNLAIDGPILNPNNSIHLVYFSATCARDGSFFDVLTPKQAKAYISSAPEMGWPSQNGLVAIAKSDDGLALTPLDYPLWTRVHWIDAKNGRLRELEPITVDTHYDLSEFPFEFGQVKFSIGNPNPGLQWNPLRSGASFVTVQESASLVATLYLICPRSSIQGNGVTIGSPAPAQGTGNGIFSPAKGFPKIQNRDGTFGFPANRTDTFGASTTIRGRIYDDNEAPKTNIAIPCDCLTIAPVKPINSIYSLAPTVLNTFTVPVWYTELEATQAVPNAALVPSGPQSQFFSFTGYWNLDLVGAAKSPATLFHRLSNSSLDNISPARQGVDGNGHPNLFNNR